MADIAIDARGMRCPWPVLRLARAARGAAAGDRILLDADDPKAADEAAALADTRGWAVSFDHGLIVVTV